MECKTFASCVIVWISIRARNRKHRPYRQIRAFAYYFVFFLQEARTCLVNLVLCYYACPSKCIPGDCETAYKNSRTKEAVKNEQFDRCFIPNHDEICVRINSNSVTMLEPMIIVSNAEHVPKQYYSKGVRDWVGASWVNRFKHNPEDQSLQKTMDYMQATSIYFQKKWCAFRDDPRWHTNYNFKSNRDKIYHYCHHVWQTRLQNPDDKEARVFSHPFEISLALNFISRGNARCSLS